MKCSDHQNKLSGNAFVCYFLWQRLVGKLVSFTNSCNITISILKLLLVYFRIKHVII